MTKVSLLYLLIVIINAPHLNMVDFEDFSISGLNSQLIISFLFQVSIHKSSTKDSRGDVVMRIFQYGIWTDSLF